MKDQSPTSRKNQQTPEEIHAAWVLERQDEERRRSIIGRLDQLACDARNERLEFAYAVLRDASENLRAAIRKDKFAKERSKNDDELFD
jgi:hypothetical protein